MSLINSEIYDLSVFVFIISALVHISIIVICIKDFRGLPGNHLEIAINQYKNGGIKGKLFAISLILIFLCFGFWVTTQFLK